MLIKSKLLIVDDDPISLRVLSEYLRGANYGFVAAENGQQAWEILQKSPQEFALVIADRIMPKMHGMELLAQMRQHQTLKNIPLIMLTGEVEKDEMVAAIKAGVFDFLHKPIEKELLLAVLKRVLQK